MSVKLFWCSSVIHTFVLRPHLQTHTRSKMLLSNSDTLFSMYINFYFYLQSIRPFTIQETCGLFKCCSLLCNELLNLVCGNKMPTRCNRGFYCRSYCLLNMVRAPLCPSSEAQEYYTVVAACGISCCGFQVAGLVWS